MNHYDADIEAWSLPHMQDLPNDTALRYDYSKQRSGARWTGEPQSVEQARNEYSEVLPERDRTIEPIEEFPPINGPTLLFVAVGLVAAIGYFVLTSGGGA